MNEIEQLVSKVNRKFSDIGRSNGTAPLMPAQFDDPRDNRGGVVHELFIANHLRKLADKRWEAAKNEALSCGVLGNYDKLGVGSHVTYNGHNFVVSVKRNAASSTIDKKMLTDVLVDKFGEAVAQEVLKAATKPRAGATVIEVSTI
jgi:hypothetical protein